MEIIMYLLPFFLFGFGIGTYIAHMDITTAVLCAVFSIVTKLTFPELEAVVHPGLRVGMLFLGLVFPVVMARMGLFISLDKYWLVKKLEANE